MRDRWMRRYLAWVATCTTKIGLLIVCESSVSSNRAVSFYFPPSGSLGIPELFKLEKSGVVGKGRTRQTFARAALEVP